MVGNVRMMNALRLPMDGLEEIVERLQAEAKTVECWFSVDNIVSGIVAVADTVKDGSRTAIEDLHHMGLYKWP